MATWDRRDPRWHVVDRKDGSNVNGWCARPLFALDQHVALVAAEGSSATMAAAHERMKDAIS